MNLDEWKEGKGETEERWLLLLLHVLFVTCIELLVRRFSSFFFFFFFLSNSNVIDQVPIFQKVY